MIIDGIGETQINSIRSFFINKTNVKVINELEKKLKIESIKQFKKDGPLEDKTFLITGKLDGMSRAEVKSLIEQNSGTIVSNVSSKLDFLITGEKPTKRKIDKAKDLGVRILNQEEFIKMLDS